MVCWRGSPIPRYFPERKVARRQLRRSLRLAHRQSPSTRYAALRGGADVSNLANFDLWAKFHRYMSLINRILDGNGKLEEILQTQRGVDVYKFMLIQMMNKNAIVELRKDTIDFFICLLNKLDISLIEADVEIDGRFTLDLGPLGTITDKRTPLKVDFSILYDSNPYSYDDEDAFYLWLAKNIAEYPMSIHLVGEKFRHRLHLQSAFAEHENFIFKFQTEPDIKRQKKIYTVVLKAMWHGPSVRLSSVMGGIREKMDVDLAQITELLSELHAYAINIPIITGLLRDGPDEWDKSKSIELLRSGEDWSRYFVTLYNQLYALKMLYQDDTGNSIEAVVKAVQPERNIWDRIQVLADAVEHYKRQCAAHWPEDVPIPEDEPTTSAASSES